MTTVSGNVSMSSCLSLSMSLSAGQRKGWLNLSQMIEVCSLMGSEHQILED